MTSREQILAAVAAAQPELKPLPEVAIESEPVEVVTKFAQVLTGIGGNVIEVADEAAAMHVLDEQFGDASKVVHAVQDADRINAAGFDPHTLEDVELAIVHARLAVAENGAVWVTDADLQQRVLPFITQHLAVLVRKADLVPTMHKAYEVIGDAEYGFGVFIAGPSKTADIEQSLVLGAHGSRTMHVFLLNA